MKIISMKKLAYLLFICIFLTGCKSCKKSLYNTYVSGTIKDEMTNEPISNLKINLLGVSEGLSSTSLANESNGISQYTDENGNFKFNFDRSEYANFYLYCDVNRYEYDQKGSLEDYIKLEFSNKYFKETVEKNITLKPFGVLKVHCKHVSIDTAGLIEVSPVILKDLGVNQGLFYPTSYIDERILILHQYAYKPIKFSFEAAYLNYAIGQYVTTKDTILTLTKTDTTYYQFNY